MRHVLATIAALGLAAPVEATEPPPCRTQALPKLQKALVGRPASPASIKRALARSGALTSRVIRPDMAVTMDYRVERLNIHVDRRNRIRRLTCG